ncbi:uncharacterized protein LOC134698152 isoform X2 [Mytilus trossulus]|uniref:uncharacterized protein LOC134698152 isoform X2 n=1 Tax=Mytilus trossulus TaxID=6551 RepID=UPI003007B9D8
MKGYDEMWNDWLCVCLSVCLYLPLIKCNTPDGTYTLSVPKVYVAFSEDLYINYTTPPTVSLPNAYIRILAGAQGTKKEITTRPLEGGKPVGQIKISCGEIEYAAIHYIELHMYVGGPLLTTISFQVTWPKFQLIFTPSHHIAQTKPLTMWYTSEAKCKSPVKRHNFHLDLEYTKDDETSTKKLNFEIKNTKVFNEIDTKIGSVEYTCETFEVAGRYIAVLRNTYDDSEVIVQSNILHVQWSTAYRISIYSSSVFPCEGHLSVKYVQPTCPGNRDQLRMYYLRRTLTGSPAVPLNRIYVTEKPAFNNQSSVLFPCGYFDAKAVGYCFVYVNMASDGSVTEQDDVCISAHPNTDGKWAVWSEWSTCSVTCGTGKRSRGRTCTDPEPANGGRFCNGFPVEFRPCVVECSEEDTVPDTPLKHLHLEGSCACGGCTLNASKGEIIGTGRCKGISQWTIAVGKGHIIILKFQYFNILIDEQWLRVRDGAKSNDNLLAQSYGLIKISKVVSSSNKLLIQFNTRFNVSVPLLYHRRLLAVDPHSKGLLSHKLSSYGFIATYKSEVDNSSSVVFDTIPLTSHHESSIWESTITIAGISLCLTVVLILCVLAIYHKFFYHKKHKYSMAAHEETPTHIAKSTSMHSSPSHHSAGSGVEIDYDMERPLTGGVKKKDSNGRVSRGSSVSSNRSGLKVKVKATVECSPKPILKQYSPMPSPKLNAIKDDSSERQSLFNTSPLLNRKPRSPKVHPSPRFKHSSKAKTPTSPDSKYDLLIKRRRRSKSDKVIKDIEERIVPGSDDTPVVEEKSFDPVKSPDSHDTLTPTNSKSPCVQNETDKPVKVDIPLVSLAKTEETRNPASGASDESSSPDNIDQTTSFISEKRPPRPTSLNEIHKNFPSSNSVSSEKRRKFGDRNKGLPQPDGESPKSSLTQSSKNSTPRSVHSSKSKLTLSPSRSITSDNLEMEYDDFIDYDDPLSYFDPEELEKLKWKGVEKISPKTKEEED